MSDAWTGTFVDKMLQFVCTYCNAKPGQPCKTRSGVKCLPHAPRYYLARGEEP
jgi:hypothetical protein